MRRPDSKWSTWSYGVLDLPGPGNEEEFERKAKEYAEDPKKRSLKAIVYDLESRSFSTREDFSRFRGNTVLVTCANCMLICWPNPEDRKENLRILTHSGRVVRCEGYKPVVTGQR